MFFNNNNKEIILLIHVNTLKNKNAPKRDAVTALEKLNKHYSITIAGEPEWANNHFKVGTYVALKWAELFGNNSILIINDDEQLSIASERVVRLGTERYPDWNSIVISLI